MPHKSQALKRPQLVMNEHRLPQWSFRTPRDEVISMSLHVPRVLPKLFGAQGLPTPKACDQEEGSQDVPHDTPRHTIYDLLLRQ